MQRVTSGHYVILFPTGAQPRNAMKEFAERRERMFAAMQKKLGGDGTNTTIRIVIAPDYQKGQQGDRGQLPAYQVTGTTIRTKPAGNLQLPAAADAEALLHESWAIPETRKSPDGSPCGSRGNRPARIWEWLPHRWSSDLGTKK